MPAQRLITIIPCPVAELYVVLVNYVLRVLPPFGQYKFLSTCGPMCQTIVASVSGSVHPQSCVLVTSA